MSGKLAKAEKTWVASVQDIHVVHADFFPLPANDDVVSHPVKAWKNGRSLDISSPKLAKILWASKYRKFFPVPNATHNSIAGSCCWSCWTPAVARTSTSLPTVRIMILRWLWLTASSACKNILVSVSSWVQGAKRDTPLRGLLQRTSWP